MRTIFAVLLGISLMSAQGLTAQGKEVAYPATIQFNRYPIISDTTNHVAKMTAMGLHLDTLEADWTGFNWYEKWEGAELKRFVYETLKTGTLVYADSAKVPRYKRICVNLLASREECPRCDYFDPRKATSDTVIFKVDLSEVADLFAPLAPKTDTVRETVYETITVPVYQNQPGWWSRNGKWVATGAGIVLTSYGVSCLGFDRCYLIRVRQVTRTRTTVLAYP